MTTTRQKVLMLSAILGLSAWCGWEAMGLHLWNTLVFGFLAVACATMFVWQVGKERRREVAGLFVRHWREHTAYRRVLFQAIRSSRNWTWRVRP